MPVEPPSWVRYRLCLNENLFIPRGFVESIVERASREVDARLYHDPYGEELAEKLADFHGLDRGEVAVGPGSDYFIRLLALEALKGKAVIVEPTFEEYRRSVEIFGGAAVEVMLGDGFSLRSRDVCGVDASVAFMASPNNPTGNQYPRESVLEVVDGFKGIVVVDEAYAEYAPYTLVGEAPSYDNLVVLRTFSKAWGLAGLRVGYAVANRDVIARLRERGLLFATSSLSLRAASIMLEHWSRVRTWVEEAKRVRDWLRSRLLALGLQAYPSDASFILVRFPFDPADLLDKLMERGFALRYYGHRPMLENCVRITVAPMEVAEELVEALGAELRG